MDKSSIIDYCEQKPNVEKGFPFPNRKQTLVFKVNGKVFCLMRLDHVPLSINLKCEPDRAIEQREQYAAVTPGYHMNKKYWNSVLIDGTISEKVILQLIDISYSLVK